MTDIEVILQLLKNDISHNLPESLRVIPISSKFDECADDIYYLLNDHEGKVYKKILAYIDKNEDIIGNVIESSFSKKVAFKLLDDMKDSYYTMISIYGKASYREGLYKGFKMAQFFLQEAKRHQKPGKHTRGKSKRANLPEIAVGNPG